MLDKLRERGCALDSSGLGQSLVAGSCEQKNEVTGNLWTI